jgi:adenosylcobyric acid synthase
MRGGVMVCGTTSDAGKSVVVAAICRMLHRRGVRVAPFKAQNMALNSFVTADGAEIGRAQAMQAEAAGLAPEAAMNPILLKPTGERTSQVVVMGRPLGHYDAVGYHALKPDLFATVCDALADLRTRYDVVVLEGAGSPAEINLLDHDIVNLRVAKAAGIPALVVGDIDRGGVFAALYGTVALLPDDLRRHVRGFVLNKFRGDPALLAPGLAELERRTSVPTLGVLPWIDGVALDAEDSLALDGPRPSAARREDRGVRGDVLDIAVVRFPRIANFTDVDPLALEPGVSVRYVVDGQSIGDPDLLLLPGTKATVADLEWLRGRGIDHAIGRASERGTIVLGICGGYQMLGASISDDVESGRGVVPGLGHLDVTTMFGVDKVTRQRRGIAMGQPVSGYEIHHGRTARAAGSDGWIHLDAVHGVEDEGAVDTRTASFLGTTLHGLFEEDGFRSAFLCEIGRRRGKTFVPAGVSFHAARASQLDRLADLLEANVDLAALDALIKEGAP